MQYLGMKIESFQGPDFPEILFIENVVFNKLVRVLGEPASWQDPNDPGPIKRWLFEYKCGLKLLYSYSILHSRLSIVGEVPEVSHALIHVPFEKAIVGIVDTVELEKQIELSSKLSFGKRYALSSLEQYGVFSGQGDSLLVAKSTHRGAHCIAEFLCDRHPSSRHWVREIEHGS